MPISTIQSTIMGKAYEYACVVALTKLLEGIRPVEVVENSSLTIARSRFSEVSENAQNDMLKSATSGLQKIMDMEPRISEDGGDLLTLSLQPDNVAMAGDIRDVLIIRRDIAWEIGISVKHNHSALKHSRLSHLIDFGNSWFGIPCSKEYFDNISPIFDNLSKLKNLNTLWSNISNKSEKIYVPILKIFVQEFNNLYSKHKKEITEGLIKYLLGSENKDYYKMIHFNNHTTRIQPFNLSGTLNLPSETEKPKIKYNQIELPTKIIDLSFKEDSFTTLHLTMDKGWAISFRIHNASSLVEPSLKFDIQLLGQPADIFYIDVAW